MVREKSRLQSTLHLSFIIFCKDLHAKRLAWEDVVVGLELDDKYPISFQPLRYGKRRDYVGFSHSVPSFEQI